MKKSEMINYMKEAAIKAYKDLKDVEAKCGAGSDNANYLRTRWMLVDMMCYDMGIKVDYQS